MKNRSIIQQIADELMTNGENEKAVRLQLRGKNEKDLGGMCRRSVECAIYRVLVQVVQAELERLTK